MTTVLVDGSYLLRRDQTGISSYASTLAATLHGLGAEVSLLLGSRAAPARSLPAIGLAGQVLGNAPERGRFVRRLRLLRQTRFGLQQRLTAVPVVADNIDVASLDPPLPPHQALFNASDFFEHARAVFALSGRFTAIELQGRADVAHWTSPAPLTARNMANVYTVHDLVPLRFPHFTIDSNGRAARVHAAVARQADHIITVSERSAEDIVQVLGVSADRISVTYQPVVPLTPLPPEDAARLASDIYGAEPGRYVFFCGAMEPKKNLARLIEAFIVANTGMQLLLAGTRGWLSSDISGLLSRLEKAEAPPVRHLGYLPRRHVAALMQGACFFAFPSIYEGFGLPVVEAMSLAVPVLTSTGGALPEVAGDAAELVDPLDVGAIMRGIRKLAADDGLRAELARRGPERAARFSGGSYAERLCGAYGRFGVGLGPATATAGDPRVGQPAPVPASGNIVAGDAYSVTASQGLQHAD
jgi:glycosyltransferase involved in cell wall biosynthesis